MPKGGPAIDGGVDGDGNKSTADRGSWLPSSLRKVLLLHLYGTDGEYLYEEEGEAFGRDGGDGGGSSNGTAEKDKAGEEIGKADGDLMEDGRDDAGFGDVDDGDGQKAVDSSHLGSPAPTAVVVLPPGSTRRGPSEGTPQLKPTSAVAVVPNLRGKGSGKAPARSLGSIGSVVGDGSRLLQSFEYSACQIGDNIDGDVTIARLGNSVSLSGDGQRMAVGTGRDTGRVEVLEWDGTAWNQMGADIFNGGGTRDVSISWDGSILAVGADTLNLVRMFQWNGVAWTQMGNDITSVAGVNDFTGNSVSLSSSGTRVAVGSYYYNENYTGYVRVFEWDGAEWILLGPGLQGDNPGDAFGISVSLSGDGQRLAVGGDKNDDNGHETGHARIYQWRSTEHIWEQLGSDINGDNQEWLGHSVSLSGDGTRVAIGAPYRNYVVLYDWDATTSMWNQIGPRIDGPNASWFGHSVSLSADGSRVAVKAKNGDGNWRGLVRILDLDLTNTESPVWTQAAADIFDEKQYGSEVSLGKTVSLSGDGKILAFGSPRKGDGTDATTELGRVRVYDIHEGSTCPVFEWMCFNPSEMSFQEHAVYANNLQTHIPDIVSAQMLSVHNDLVNEMVASVYFLSGSSTPSFIYLGYSDLEQEGIWQWEDGSANSCFEKWTRTEPDNWGGFEHCMVYATHDGCNCWWDHDCGAPFGAMYQITTSSASNPDLHCLPLDVPNACEGQCEFIWTIFSFSLVVL